MRLFLVFFGGLSLVWAHAFTAKESIHPFVYQLQQDTEKSLESMRSLTTSLVGDKTIWSEDFSSFENNGAIFSTNIALDLILLLKKNHSSSYEKITQILQSLLKLERFKIQNSKLFYWSYAKTAGSNSGYHVSYAEVSSLDNFHLAFAFWLVARMHPEQDTKNLAQQFFNEMSLDPFVNRETGMIHGAYVQNQTSGEYQLTTFTYSFYGSETRSLYAMAPAIGLISDTKGNLYELFKKNLEIECTQNSHGKKIIRTWDGGVFQYLLPELLYGESHYSSPMRDTFLGLVEVAESYKKNLNLSFLPGFSACQTAVKNHPIFQGLNLSTYSGVKGFYPLMATRNQLNHSQEKTEGVVTFHASLMLAMFDPQKYFQEFYELSSQKAKNGPLYIKDHGFMDSYHVNGVLENVVVPAQLALDQGMIALALDRILSPDQKSFPARVLASDTVASEKIQLFYQQMNPKLKAACDVPLK